MVKVNIAQLLTVDELQFVINDKTLHLLLVLFIGILIVGPDIDINFFMVMMKIVKHDKNMMLILFLFILRMLNNILRLRVELRNIYFHLILILASFCPCSVAEPNLVKYVLFKRYWTLGLQVFRVIHGFHFFGLTNFPDIYFFHCSSISLSLFLKYGTVFPWILLFLTDKFP